MTNQISALDLGLQLVKGVGLDSPAVGLVAAGEVGLGIGITAEDILKPVEADLAEPAAVLVAQSAAVTDVDVALPCGGVGGEILVVSLAL